MKDKPARIGELTFYSGLDDLSGKSASEKVAWFRGRFDKVVGRPLREVRALGVENSAIWDLNLGVVTIICSAIQALSSFYAPGAEYESAFRTFVCEFMDPKYREKPTANARTYAEILYGKFRCGLAHGLSIEGHQVTTRPDEYIVDENGHVSIDLWSLFEDLERACGRYLARVETDASTGAEFLRRFDQLFVQPYARREAEQRPYPPTAGEGLEKGGIRS